MCLLLALLVASATGYNFGNGYAYITTALTTTPTRKPTRTPTFVPTALPTAPPTPVPAAVISTSAPTQTPTRTPTRTPTTQSSYAPSAIIISTVAGTGSTSYNSDGIAATSAALNWPYGVAFDSYDDLCIGDLMNFRVRKVAMTSGIITTYAGAGSGSYSGDGGQATAAGIYLPTGLSFDSSNNLFISEYGSHRVRRVDYISKVITTVAGTGTAGSSGDGGAATSARLNYPTGVIVDSSGSYLYISDRSNSKIRRVSLSTSIITVYAGTGSTVYGGDGGPATSAGMYDPHQMSLDRDGNMYVTDSNGHRVRRIVALTSIITTVAGTGAAGSSGDGGAATSAMLYFPVGAHINKLDGLLYIGDYINCRLRRVASDGTISTMAGTGTCSFSGEGVEASSASLGYICEVASNSKGDVYFADKDNSNRVRRLSMGYGTPSYAPSRKPTAVPSTAPSTLQMYRLYTISVIAGTGATANIGDGGPGTSAALNYPYAVAVDKTSSNLYISVVDHHRVRTLSLMTGIITTIAGTGTEGSSGDGGYATSAKLYKPHGLVLDNSNEYLYISDWANFVIRRVSLSTHIIRLYAGTYRSYGSTDGAATSAKFNRVHHIAMDSNNNMYLADTDNHKIRRIEYSSSIVSTFAGTGASSYRGDGGAATSAALFLPKGVTVDALGNVYISDTFNNRIRRVSFSTSMITTIAGTGLQGFSGDGGNPTQANITHPDGLVFDSSGDLYFTDGTSDVSNQRVRKVAISSSIITTYAGTGNATYRNEMSVSATAANLNYPRGVTVDSTGTLYIIESEGDRVRQVTVTYSPSAKPTISPTISSTAAPTTSPLSDAPTTSPSGQPTSQPTIACVPGQYFRDDACYDCNSGTYSDSHQCIPCAPGSFSAQNRTSVCSLCPQNEFSDTIGSTSCSACAKGRLTSGPGAISIAYCISPGANFAFGFIALILCCLIGYVYLYTGRVFDISLSRYRDQCIPIIAEVKRSSKHVHSSLGKVNRDINALVKLRDENLAKQAKRDMYEDYKWVFFFFASLFAVAALTTLYLSLMLLQIFFGSLLIYRDHGIRPLIDMSFLNVINRQMSSLWGAIRIILEPFVLLMSLFANLDLDLALDSINVTCDGSKLPIYLLYDFSVYALGCVFVLAEYNVLFGSINHFIRNGFLVLHQKHLSLLLMEVDRFIKLEWYRKFAVCLSKIVIGNSIASLLKYNPLLALLQIAVSFIQVTKIILYSSSINTPECNRVAGVPNIDAFLGNGTSILFWFFAPSTVYCLADMLVPYWHKAISRVGTKSSNSYSAVPTQDELKTELDEFKAFYLLENQNFHRRKFEFSATIQEDTTVELADLEKKGLLKRERRASLIERGSNETIVPLRIFSNNAYYQYISQCTKQVVTNIAPDILMMRVLKCCIDFKMLSPSEAVFQLPGHNTPGPTPSSRRRAEDGFLASENIRKLPRFSDLATDILRRTKPTTPIPTTTSTSVPMTSTSPEWIPPKNNLEEKLTTLPPILISLIAIAPLSAFCGVLGWIPRTNLDYGIFIGYREPVNKEKAENANADECGICWKFLASTKVSCCMTSNNKHCNHYFHTGCLEKWQTPGIPKTCPCCQNPYDDVSPPIPSPLTDKIEFFKFLDGDGNGIISMLELIKGLQATLEIDWDKIEEHVKDKFPTWNVDGDGSISIGEFNKPDGVLTYLKEHSRGVVESRLIDLFWIFCFCFRIFWFPFRVTASIWSPVVLYALICTGWGHLLDSHGRREWGNVALKFATFSKVSFLGLWDLKTFDAFGLGTQKIGDDLNIDDVIVSDTDDIFYTSRLISSLLSARGFIFLAIPYMSFLSVYLKNTADFPLFPDVSDREVSLLGGMPVSRYPSIKFFPFLTFLSSNEWPKMSVYETFDSYPFIMKKLLFMHETLEQSRILNWMLGMYNTVISLSILFNTSDNILFYSAVCVLLPAAFIRSLNGVVFFAYYFNIITRNGGSVSQVEMAPAFTSVTQSGGLQLSSV